VIEKEWIDEIKVTLPELPDEKKDRFIREFGLPSYDAQVLTSSRELAEYFESCIKEFKDKKPSLYKQASNWIMVSVLGLLNAEGKSIEDSPVSAHALADLLMLTDEGVINSSIAKTVFDEMAKTGKPAKEIVKEKGLTQVTDVSAIESAVLKVISQNPKEVEGYKNGKTKLLSFFVGQVMKETKGKANPQIVNELLKGKL